MEQNHYELLYIVSIKHIEADLQKVRDAVAAIITNHGGAITRDEVLAKQRLAYPIKHVHQGTYVVVECDITPDQVKEVTDQLGIMPELLRHMMMTCKPLSAKEREQEQRVVAALAEEQAQRMQARPDMAQPAMRTQPVVEEVVVKEKVEKPKTSLQDLDKKLDEILTEEVL
jgi:ribosomal protein S6